MAARVERDEPQHGTRGGRKKNAFFFVFFRGDAATQGLVSCRDHIRGEG